MTSATTTIEDEGTRRRGRNGNRLARRLGWFSIGLGLAEVTAPRAVGRLIGLDPDEHETRLRLFGVREIASGIGILTSSRSAAWVWSRVGGDAMDLAFLATAARRRKATRDRIAVAGLAVAGVAALDVIASRRQTAARGSAGTVGSRDTRVHVNTSVTINRQPGEIYEFWRNFENLPRFMEHLRSVEIIDDRRSRWEVNAPAGTRVTWEAEIARDTPGQSIEWRSLPSADVPNSGIVRFTPAPGNRGTEVRVELRYDAPGGTLGTVIAKLFGEEPGQQVASDLRRLKQLLETGEVLLVESPRTASVS
jgi:uncharacterized membrane protein